MTIEVRQLVVRVIVEEPPPRPRTHSAEFGGQSHERRGRADLQLPPAERRALVAECVREVLRALERIRRR